MPRTGRNTENVRVTTYVVVLESPFNPYTYSYHRVTKHAMIGRTFSRDLSLLILPQQTLMATRRSAASQNTAVLGSVIRDLTLAIDVGDGLAL
jgi:hypothetical protein